MKPGRLTEDTVYDAVRERLMATHIRRSEMWRHNEAFRKEGRFSALESIRTPDIIVGPRRHIHVNIEVWLLGDVVQMCIEAIEIVDDDPEDPRAHLLPPGGGEAFLRRATYCIVSTGERCPPIYDDDEEL